MIHLKETYLHYLSSSQTKTWNHYLPNGHYTVLQRENIRKLQLWDCREPLSPASAFPLTWGFPNYGPLPVLLNKVLSEQSYSRPFPCYPQPCDHCPLHCNDRPRVAIFIGRACQLLPWAPATRVTTPFVRQAGTSHSTSSWWFFLCYPKIHSSTNSLFQTQVPDECSLILYHLVYVPLPLKYLSGSPLPSRGQSS